MVSFVYMISIVLGEVGKEVVKLLAEKKLFKRVVLFGRRLVNYEGEQFKNLVRVIMQNLIYTQILHKSNSAVCLKCN